MAGGNTGKALGVAMSEPTLDSVAVTGSAQFDGNCALGSEAADLVGMHGAAVAQATAIATFVSGTAVTTATYGIPTPDIAALGTAINSVIVALRNKGIIASS